MATELSPADAARMVERLRDPRRYPHRVEEVQVVETHISWVLLAGDYAYKLKKPLDLGFLDFSTYEKRLKACIEEVRLNRRLAPEIYLDVVAITGTAEEPRVAGGVEAIDHAVRMFRFDRSQELDRLLAGQRLPIERIDELARLVARFHGSVPAADPSGPYGTPETALANPLANFEHLAALEHGADDVSRVAALREWTVATHARLTPVIRERLAEGFVRECHGDLHLANMVLHGGRVVVFDCIEFNPRLRWIDVISEVAFTVMDLRHRGRADFAQRFLTDYLEETGDYAGLRLLPYYLVYRSMVRAKVAAIRAAQEQDPAARDRDEADFRAHLALAESFAAPRAPALAITMGASGSGKSYLAAKLVDSGAWIRARSDVERKRIAGLPAAERTKSAVGAGLYLAEMTDWTYARLADVARHAIAAGFPIVVDATFLERARRDAFRALAQELGVPFVILVPETPVAVMRERVVARERAGADASEATPAVLDRQLALAEPLAPDELAFAVRVDTGRANDATELALRVQERIAPPRRN
jgi:aminoglycoside phosphotransferase family enzyme/predicted kinase